MTFVPSIFNVRGTSGSGKTHLVRQIVEHYQATEILVETKRGPKILGYEIPSLGLRILGRYDRAIKGGGVDNSTGLLQQIHGGNSMDAPEAQIRIWLAEGWNVLFEGLIVTSVWTRWLRLNEDILNGFYFLFLDTPLEVCQARVQARNGGKPLKVSPKTGRGSLEDKWKDVHEKQAPWAEELGLNWSWLEHEHAVEELDHLLRTLCAPQSL